MQYEQMRLPLFIIGFSPRRKDAKVAKGSLLLGCRGALFPAQVYDPGDGAGKTRPYDKSRGRI